MSQSKAKAKGTPGGGPDDWQADALAEVRRMIHEADPDIIEERKWIKGRWVEKAGQRRRRYYSITSEGRNVLAAQRKEWRQFFALIRDLAGVRYA